MKWTNMDIAAAIMTTIVVVTSATPAFSENWVEVSASKRVYMDMDSISTSGRYTSVVVQWDKSLSDGPFLEVNNTMHFDCVKNIHKYVGQEAKKRDGTFVYVEAVKDLYQDTNSDELWKAISSKICPP